MEKKFITYCSIKDLVQISKVTKMANIYKNICYKCTYTVIYVYKNIHY